MMNSNQKLVLVLAILVALAGGYYYYTYYYTASATTPTPTPFYVAPTILPPVTDAAVLSPAQDCVSCRKLYTDAVAANTSFNSKTMPGCDTCELMVNVPYTTTASTVFNQSAPVLYTIPSTAPLCNKAACDAVKADWDKRGWYYNASDFSECAGCL